MMFDGFWISIISRIKQITGVCNLTIFSTDKFFPLKFSKGLILVNITLKENSSFNPCLVISVNCVKQLTAIVRSAEFIVVNCFQSETGHLTEG